MSLVFKDDNNNDRGDIQLQNPGQKRIQRVLQENLKEKK